MFCSAKQRCDNYAETVRRRIGIYWRDRAVFDMRKDGAPIQRIVDRFGICKTRVFQILLAIKKEFPK